MLKLDAKKDLLVIIDVVNGFVNKGAFASDVVKAMVPSLEKFVDKSIERGVKVIHYTDVHEENSREFENFPVHCVKGTEESFPVEELLKEEIDIIPKNSTNGFFVKNPFDYKKNVYITGCVTDICVFQYALTAIKYRDEYELPYEVYVIEDLVRTFDGPGHDSDEIQELYLGILDGQGVKIISL